MSGCPQLVVEPMEGQPSLAQTWRSDTSLPGPIFCSQGRAAPS